MADFVNPVSLKAITNWRTCSIKHAVHFISCSTQSIWIVIHINSRMRLTCSHQMSLYFNLYTWQVCHSPLNPLRASCSGSSTVSGLSFQRAVFDSCGSWRSHSSCCSWGAGDRRNGTSVRQAPSRSPVDGRRTSIESLPNKNSPVTDVCI